MPDRRSGDKNADRVIETPDFSSMIDPYRETMMRTDPVRETDAGIHDAESERLSRKVWSTPSVAVLRAGLAETGPNAGYDGVEGTS